MTIRIAAVCCLSVSILLSGCGTGPESMGHRAYKEAKTATGDQKRLLQKKAYMHYQQALKAHPNRVSPKLRQRFIEMCLVRADMVLVEGSKEYDAIPLFVEDIDKYWLPDLPPELKEEYAGFLVTLADSIVASDKIVEGLEYMDKAIGVAHNKEEYIQEKKDLVKKVVERNYETANIAYEQGKLNEDSEDLIRAEYHAKVALAFDSTNQKARELLSKILKANVGTYSAYTSVITDVRDTTLYDQINTYDILLAVPTTLRVGRILKTQVHMYNYSYNPLRLRARDFYLVDANGKEYRALSSSRITPEILDQEHETKMKINFPRPAAKIKKLVYENGDHYSEKLFY